ncbi:leucine-rich repeat-containing protein 56 [Paramisgurnus dabryanus]|uniref:leucine-rich repeat-containing protein 56 n=1 Tax=Paramisgurnus dabryanus TaxID=90735 RepID=UPI0031F435DE
MSDIFIKRPGTAPVNKFNGSDVIQTPADDEDSDHVMVELSLSPAKLKILSGADNLEEVTSLEMCVDTRQISLNNFGVYLPKLRELKMNNSLILSIRDLGTSLSHLQVLWLARCGLTDLEGIPCLSSLKELYVAYNNISELIHLSMMDHLEVLDLEGNDVDDLLNQVWHLGHCKNLRTLSLEGNPVCTRPSPGSSEADYSYRSAVREMIPQLRFLDDVPVEEDKPDCGRSTQMDWTLLRESIKDFSISDTQEYTETEERSVSVCGGRPGSAQHLSPRISSNSVYSRPGSARPLTSCSRSTPGSNNSNPATLDHELSNLTSGFGSFLCGNPLQAVRARTQKQMVQNSRSQTRPSTRLGSYIPERTYDDEQPSSQDRSDVFAELRSWRIEHNKRLSAIEKDRQPQVMKILHCDDEYDEEDDDCSHNHSFISDDITRNEKEEERTVYKATTSANSSFQSFSPDLLHQDTDLQNEIRVTSTSDCMMSPSPPLSALAPPGGRRITQIRTRRIKPHNGEIGMSMPSEDKQTSNIGALKTNSISEPQSNTTVKTMSTQILRKPCRPSTSLGVSPLRAQWSEAPGNHHQSENQHKPVIRSNTSHQLTPKRPQTARAALQRLPNRTLLPNRGNGILE